MRVLPTDLEGVVCIEPRVFEDQRGYFLESWSRRVYEQLGITTAFVQDNLSFSRRGVLRGLHLQNPRAQGKLVQAPRGAVFDVAVDVRVGSRTFGRWVGYELSEDNHRQLYIPPGFAHGFCVLSEVALLSYKCTEYHAPDAELGIHHADPEIAVAWPIDNPAVSERDAKLPQLREIPEERLPRP
jgi:dTDP-4-dehydrorhamnose 3,5-epimerase